MTKLLSAGWPSWMFLVPMATNITLSMLIHWWLLFYCNCDAPIKKSATVH